MVSPMYIDSDRHQATDAPALEMQIVGLEGNAGRPPTAIGELTR